MNERQEWTAQDIETLERLVGEEFSAGEIGKRMGRTRNAIIGKIIRMKGGVGRLARSQGKAGKVARKQSPSIKMVRRSHPVPAPKLVFERPQPYVPVANLPATLPIRFLDAVDRKLCLHFVGDPFGPDGPDMPVCGAARSEAAGTVPYCRRHFESAHSQREAPLSGLPAISPAGGEIEQLRRRSYRAVPA
ncbi:GcrA family cell cycle regulator [Mesorhizobium sp. GbtcB19]|uniref:GcrA family cell cycle regulator n=1 Tax=Mesorhizobium sp. GbtcB19 TaxID=2824764 RepID=UPI001C2F1FC4|nr:GcrA family cell cycle regulator [Mesorhizobium sp. GbtcB19]